MRGFFYFPINIDISPDVSIVKKNKEIVASAARLGIACDVITFSFRGISLNGELICRVSNNPLARGLHNNGLAYKVLLERCTFSHYDFVWVRAGLCLPPQLAFFREVRRQNPRVKLLLEYGSFPFKKEMFGYQKLLFPLHERFAKALKKDVTYVITYCGQDEIYGIPCIKIGNGIDVTATTFGCNYQFSDNTLHFISVSGLMYWHAYDRVIRGVGEYYTKKAKDAPDIVVHIVGDGGERVRLENMTLMLGLSDKIIFHGVKTGHALDQIFKKAHLGIGTLGMHRKGLEADSSLKNREYFARGLPLVLATSDSDFPRDLPFVHYVSGCEEALKIESLVSFYMEIRERFPDYREKIRSYAESYLTWDAKLSQVLVELALE